MKQALIQFNKADQFLFDCFSLQQRPLASGDAVQVRFYFKILFFDPNT
ncbi:hypothetical protein LXL81_05515 [Dyadobacter sp. CY356]|nr:hypothetical protein [Dyadobacter sp. CY356]